MTFVDFRRDWRKQNGRRRPFWKKNFFFLILGLKPFLGKTKMAAMTPGSHFEKKNFADFQFKIDFGQFQTKKKFFFEKTRWLPWPLAAILKKKFLLIFSLKSILGNFRPKKFFFGKNKMAAIIAGGHFGKKNFADFHFKIHFVRNPEGSSRKNVKSVWADY